MFGANRQSGNSARAPRRADARMLADPGRALATPHYRSADARQANRPTCADVTAGQPACRYWLADQRTCVRIAPEASAEDRVQSGEIPVDDAGYVLDRLDPVGLRLPAGRWSRQDRQLIVDVAA